jgi:hypothetical protein
MACDSATPRIGRPCPQPSCEISRSGLSTDLMNDGRQPTTRILVVLGLPKLAACWLSLVALGSRVRFPSFGECDGTRYGVCEVSMGQYLESAVRIQEMLDSQPTLKANCASTVSS